MDEVLRDITGLYQKLPKPLKVVAAPNIGSLIRTMNTIKEELERLESGEEEEGAARIELPLAAIDTLRVRSRTSLWVCRVFMLIATVSVISLKMESPESCFLHTSQAKVF